MKAFGMAVGTSNFSRCRTRGVSAPFLRRSSGLPTTALDQRRDRLRREMVPVTLGKIWERLAKDRKRSRARRRRNDKTVVPPPKPKRTSRLLPLRLRRAGEGR